MKEYLNITSQGSENKLEIKVDYELGGYNVWNGETNKRGYYLYVMPVEVKEKDGYTTYSHILGKGYKLLLKEVGRKSAKAEAEAEKIAKSQMRRIVNAVCSHYGILLREELKC